RLPGTILANDPHHLAALDLEGHILERPELLHFIANHQLAASQHVGSRMGNPARTARKRVTHSGIALAHIGLVANLIFLADVLGAYHDIVHAETGVSRKSNGPEFDWPCATAVACPVPRPPYFPDPMGTRK